MNKIPTSSAEPIFDVLKAAIYWEPKSVLDIGAGFGKYGVLMREYLDVRNGRVYQKDWKTVIDAIEIYDPYVSSNYGVYNSVRLGDIEKIKIEKYDLILLMDVIEHLTKKKGLQLVRDLRKKCKNLLITTPIGFSKQGKFAGNIYEVHKSGFLPKDFNEFKPIVKVYGEVMLVRIEGLLK